MKTLLCKTFDIQVVAISGGEWYAHPQRGACGLKNSISIGDS